MGIPKMTKFVKMDESGPAYKGGNFVMFGLMIDAVDFLRIDSSFRKIFSGIATEYSLQKDEFKSKNINRMHLKQKEEILTKICDTILAEDIRIFGIAISMEKYDKDEIKKRMRYDETKKRMRNIDEPNHWTMCSIYNCAMIQKWIERKEKKSCYTVVFSDDHSSVFNVARMLHEYAPWFDGLYQKQRDSRNDENRFDRIMDKTVFPEESQNSPIIQAVDAVCHIYRRNLDLLDEEYQNKSHKERKRMDNESKLYKRLVEVLEARRERIDNPPDTECVDYFQSIKCSNWAL